MNLAQKILKQNRGMISDIAKTENIARATIIKAINGNDEVHFDNKFKVFSYFLEKKLITKDLILPDLFKKIEVGNEK